MVAGILDNDKNFLENELTFQQDGAPSHYNVHVRQFLDEGFPGRWISRRDLVQWSARSLGLTLVHFLLKSKVYTNQTEILK